MATQYTTISKKCPFCGKAQVITVNVEHYKKWRAGTLVQDIFPYLSPDQRELLMTGICPTCWDETFSKT